MPPQPSPPAAPPPEPLFVLRGHRAAVQCVAFLPDCQALAAGDGEGELKLWDLGSRRAADSIRAHEATSGILSVACPAASASVVSQGRDGVVKCWQLHSGSSISRQPVQQLASGSFNFCRFALLEPGQACSSCPLGSHAMAAAHAAAQQQQLHSSGGVVVEGFAAATTAGPDAAATAATRAQQASLPGLLSVQLKQQQQQPQQLSSQLQDMSLVQQRDNAADLTEAAEEQLVLGSSIRGGAGSTPAASSTGGPCYLALPADEAATLGIWQLGLPGCSSSSSSQQQPVMLLQQTKSPGRPSRGLCMAVVLLQPQGRPLHALTGYEDGSVALWDCRNTRTYVAAQKLHTESVMCLAATPDCSSGFSGSADDQLAAFDVDVAQGQLRAGPAAQLPKPGLADVAVRPDGRIAVSAGWDCKLRVWHACKRAPLAVLRWHSQQAACVGFSSDSTLMAAGGRDNFISVWSVYPPR